eukprot:Blabericola_migrator_1__2714@NODE_1772_length_3817_cov_116_193600_g1107_i2_p1_GENE_NODE_1772_length_3817_cov_116_193600_g1107_i2NODE_1772_length_3817_cov_116_193600_g1107_i2_p1_ORF_typecomplete_len566_score67_53Kelch_6/PF13964_6/8_5e03Kelch_6/PF13964_6/5_3e02Kelch_6/PF13964_6/4e08Kelch_6/PF13964_6/1_1e03Kelch_6/PF13964_6/82Kelch_4/PF13418_6/2_1e03Kelch_4/PF13418_6/6e07Kelch_4/PF13418_6/7e02Kelch_1/PF01344_25/3_7e03Kelch_1/PF01344_25/5_8e03Kelch_1/PF01344_25/9_9e02Kelch_1/PF01344_25/3_8e06Kelch_1
MHVKEDYLNTDDTPANPPRETATAGSTVTATRSSPVILCPPAGILNSPFGNLSLSRLPEDEPLCVSPATKVDVLDHVIEHEHRNKGRQYIMAGHIKAQPLSHQLEPLTDDADLFKIGTLKQPIGASQESLYDSDRIGSDQGRELDSIRSPRIVRMSTCLSVKEIMSNLAAPPAFDTPTVWSKSTDQNGNESSEPPERSVQEETIYYEYVPPVVGQRVLITEGYVYVISGNRLRKCSRFSGCIFYPLFSGTFAGIRGTSLLFWWERPMALRRFDTYHDEWFSIPLDSPDKESPRGLLTFGICGDMLVAIGDGPSNVSSTLHIYHRNCWRSIGALNPAPAWEKDALLTPTDTGLIFVAGSLGSTATWWLDMRPVMQNPRKGIPLWGKLCDTGVKGAGAAVHDGKVYVFGGRLNAIAPMPMETVMLSNDIWVFDLALRIWSRLGVTGIPDMVGVVYHQPDSYTEIELKPSQFWSPSFVRTWKWTVCPARLTAPLARSHALVTVENGWLYVAGNPSAVEGWPQFDDMWKIHLDVPCNVRKWELVDPGSYWRINELMVRIDEPTTRASGH